MTTSNLLKGYQDEQGRFTHLPGKKQRDKFELLLRYLANRFEVGKTYNEQEINDILNQHHSFNDPAVLRRYLCGNKLLDRTRDGRAYWRI